MALTLNAEQKSIYHIFSGEIQYVIPPYQRAYSWTEIHCRKLFEDVKKAFYNEEKEGYFLGNIVLAKSRENRNSLEVIDGQQRLTSLILLIKVLLYFDKENKALYDSIWIKDRRTDNEAQRLKTDIFMEQDYNYFKEVLAFDFDMNVCESISKEDNLFKQNICYFYNEIKDFKKHNDISKFSDFLLDYVYLLPIETEDVSAEKARKSAFQIFETINNRGLNLSTSDIFKAELYSMALNELEHENFIEQWRELNNKCNQEGYSLNDTFDIYQAIILYENNKSSLSEMESYEFFLESKYSPFLYKEHNEIMNDLLAIYKFTEYFIEVIKKPNKYLELSKWFQLVHQSLIDRGLSLDVFYSSFYKSDFNNHDKLITISKDIICINESKVIVKYDEFINEFYPAFDKNEFLKMRKNLYYKEDFLILLGLYVTPSQKAIDDYPMDNGFDFIFGDIVKIDIEDLIELDSKTINKEILKDKAYKFIMDYYEN